MRYYTTQQAAAALNVDRRTITRHAGKLDLPRLGNAYLISAADLKRLKASIESAQSGNPALQEDGGPARVRAGVRRA